MKTLTLGNHTLLLIPKIEDTWQHHIDKRDDPNRLYFRHQLEAWQFTQLPPGKWRYVALSSEITEDECAQLVAMVSNVGGGNLDGAYEQGMDLYINYCNTTEAFWKATESFSSFLQANKIEGTVAVLIKE